MDGVGAADRAGAGLGQADVEDLTLAHQLGQHAGSVLDGSARVDAVLVVQVDAVGAQPRQRALDSSTDVGRAAVDHATLAPGGETSPNFVATTTSSRRPLIASPTISSLWNGP